MNHLLGQKMKVTLSLEDGTFFELNAISSQIIQSIDMINATEFGGGHQLIPGNTQIEMSFVGVGDVSTGIKKTMIVCIGCGSEWHDAKFHPGTCANCGWGAMDTKKEMEI